MKNNYKNHVWKPEEKRSLGRPTYRGENNIKTDLYICSRQHWFFIMYYIKMFFKSAGQERFTWMTRVYYKDAHGCVIMFDITNRNSFINTLKWKRDVDSKCSLADGSSIPCVLLANKVGQLICVNWLSSIKSSGIIMGNGCLLSVFIPEVT